MKSVKKRFKLLLAEIEQSATDLQLLTAELSALQDIHGLAMDVLTVCEQLRRQSAEFSKSEFAEEILELEVLTKVDEFVDYDAISALEDRLFSATNVISEDGGVMVLLLQQLMEKLEKRHAVMIDSMQQLLALVDRG